MQKQAEASERIANALEAIASGLGFRVSPIRPDERPAKDAPDLAYADDMTTASNEAHDELVALGYKPAEDESVQ